MNKAENAIPHPAVSPANNYDPPSPLVDYPWQHQPHWRKAWFKMLTTEWTFGTTSFMTKGKTVSSTHNTADTKCVGFFLTLCSSLTPSGCPIIWFHLTLTRVHRLIAQFFYTWNLNCKFLRSPGYQQLLSHWKEIGASHYSSSSFINF